MDSRTLAGICLPSDPFKPGILLAVRSTLQCAPPSARAGGSEHPSAICGQVLFTLLQSHHSQQDELNKVCWSRNHLTRRLYLFRNARTNESCFLSQRFLSCGVTLFPSWNTDESSSSHSSFSCPVIYCSFSFFLLRLREVFRALPNFWCFLTCFWWICLFQS